MGTVLEVENVLISKNFALKIIDMQIASPDAVRRFQREAKLLSELDHPNIIKALDFGILEDATPYVLMELISGQTLAEYLRQNGKLSPDKFNELFIPVVSALEFAHSRGIVHRDLKPGNIMVASKDGRLAPKLLDFGIAAWTERAAEALTKTGELFGTPLYISPEQVSGQPITVRSDLYSLGCVMFEALTGVPPFTGRTVMETLIMHREAAPPTLREASLGGNYPKHLQSILGKLLQKDPEQRFQSATEVKEALLKQSDSAPARQKNEVAGTAKSSKTKAIVLGAIGLLVVLAGIGGYMAINLSKSPNGSKNSTTNNSMPPHTEPANAIASTSNSAYAAERRDGEDSSFGAATLDLTKTSMSPIEAKTIGADVQLPFNKADNLIGRILWFDGTDHAENTNHNISIPAKSKFWLKVELSNPVAADELGRFATTPLYGLLMHVEKNSAFLMLDETMTKCLKLMPDSIKALMFDETHIEVADAKALSHLSKIEWFGLKDSNIANEALPLLAAATVTKDLETLVLNPAVEDPQQAKMAPPFLQKLATSKNNLKSLCVAHCALTAQDCEIIAKLNKLEYLNVMNSFNEIDRPTALKILSHSPNLRALAINGEDIKEQSVSSVLAIKSIKRVVIANVLAPSIRQKLERAKIKIEENSAGPDTGFQPWKSADVTTN